MDTKIEPQASDAGLLIEIFLERPIVVNSEAKQNGRSLHQGLGDHIAAVIIPTDPYQII
jgi:hypothetical protein